MELENPFPVDGNVRGVEIRKLLLIYGLCTVFMIKSTTKFINWKVSKYYCMKNNLIDSLRNSLVPYIVICQESK